MDFKSGSTASVNGVAFLTALQVLKNWLPNLDPWSLSAVISFNKMPASFLIRRFNLSFTQAKAERRQFFASSNRDELKYSLSRISWLARCSHGIRAMAQRGSFLIRTL